MRCLGLSAWPVFSEGLGLPSWLSPSWSLKEHQQYHPNLSEKHRSGGQCSHIRHTYVPSVDAG